MTDVFTKTKRSEVMSRIRGRGNKDTEMALAKLFRAHRITGWRRNLPVFGKPDFVFLKLRLAIFVDGCFWHCCPLHATKPKSNAAFWRNKLATNQTRDRLVTSTLKSAGWQVLRIWEHELLAKGTSQVVLRVRKSIRIASWRAASRAKTVVLRGSQRQR